MWYREGENLKNSNDFALFKLLTLWCCGSRYYVTGNAISFKFFHSLSFLLYREFASCNGDFLILFCQGDGMQPNWYGRVN